MPSYRVGVIFGSRSTEHEVSVVTALQVMSFLKDRHEVIPIYITKAGTWLTGAALLAADTYKQFDPKASKLEPVIISPDAGLQALTNPLPQGFLGKPRKLALDVVFPAVHGTHGEDGTLQGLLELANLPYVGATVLGASVGMDKVITKAVLQENGIPVLDYLWFTRGEWERDADGVMARIQKRFPFPLVIKPANLGSTIGIQKVDRAEDLSFVVDSAVHFSHRILVEPFLATNQEINCAVMGVDEFIPSVCEQPSSRSDLLTYDDKYLHGEQESGMAGAERLIPAPLSEERTREIQALAIEAFRCIDGVGLARVDFMIDRNTDQVYVNEINTMPGSISFYLWEPSGIPPRELVDRLLALAFQVHQRKRQTDFTIASPLLQQTDLLGLKK